jgi:hypothetical protein
MEGLKRIGSPRKSQTEISCEVCKQPTHNPTRVCHGCEGLVVGKMHPLRNSVIFREIARPEHEWEYILPTR